MNIETTLNMRVEVLDELTRAARVTGRTRSDIIVGLLKIVMEKDLNKTEMLRSVKYQKKADKNSWHRFHITLKAADYEFFLDLRKFLKMSVSRLVAYAVKKYLNELLNHGENKSIADNCPFNDYHLIRGYKNGFIFWHILWGREADKIHDEYKLMNI